MWVVWISFGFILGFVTGLLVHAEEVHDLEAANRHLRRRLRSYMSGRQ